MTFIAGVLATSAGLIAIWSTLIARRFLVGLGLMLFGSTVVALAVEFNEMRTVADMRTAVVLAYVTMQMMAYAICLVLALAILLLCSKLYGMTFQQLWRFARGRSGWRFDKFDDL